MRLIRSSAVASAFLFSVVLSACGGGGGGGDVTGSPPSGSPTAVTAVTGAQATVVAGSTTPVALTAKVTDAGGKGVSGVTVTWGTQSGSISPATASTDAGGQTTAQWTPGTVAGSTSVVATVTGVGSASFSETINPAALAKIKLTPDTLKLFTAGQTGTVTLAAYDAFDNAIAASSVNATFTSDNPGVATVNSSGTVTAVASGTTAIRATAGAISGSSTVVVSVSSGATSCTGAAMTLGVGEAQTLTGTSANQFCINGAAGAEFVAISFYGTGNGGTGSGQGTFTAAPTLSMILQPLTNTTVSGPPTPSVGSDARVRNSMTIGPDATYTRNVKWEAQFRERVRKEFSPYIRRVRGRGPSNGARLSLGIAADVIPGQKLQLNVNVGSSCSNPTLVSATVQAVSTHAIVVEDDRDPGGFSPADYASVASVFDSQIWQTDTDNFGTPTDIDSNGRIILFFTRAVNELSPVHSTSFVGGFFYGRDLLYKDNPQLQGTFKCPGSNEGELFYLLAADPTGTVNQNVWSVDRVKSITPGTVAHEFQHLINFGRHLWVNSVVNAFEETFLDEGLAHVAEELNFYAATGLTARSNLNASTATSNSSAYAAFADQNARRFREYLRNPDLYPPYSVLADTSLSVRGGIWSFLRYATDQRNSSVVEKTTWFQLVNPTTDVEGINNLKAVFGNNLLSQMRDWAVANYLDDAGTANTTLAYKHLSWNTRSVETNSNGTNGSGGTVFPLKVQTLVTSPVSLLLADGGAAYFRFGVTAGQVGGATVSSSSALPATFSITVVRTK